MGTEKPVENEIRKLLNQTIGRCRMDRYPFSSVDLRVEENIVFVMRPGGFERMISNLVKNAGSVW